MAVEKMNCVQAIESRFPGLIEKVRAVILDSENALEGHDGGSESFLWEHTMHVTSIAYRLAQEEGLDPHIPIVAALFHDIGKFTGGRYHRDEIIEEEESAQIAERLLPEFGMKKGELRKVLSGLRALYNEKIRKNPVAAILHDADFLSKFGALGVASFFTKSTLRRRPLRASVFGYLSKELTYAACLPLNMHTAAGCKLAAKKATDSLKFFRALLTELREAHIADLRIRNIRIPHPNYRNRSLEIRYVLPPACPECGGRWDMAWGTEKDVKCTKLNIEWNCRQCAERLETSFCLPEIA
ncbi:MAG: HD domain-containing protein [Acidobacteria bacterium]|nr:HD domain-containing protein [Acidobacteriota bacterium]